MPLSSLLVNIFLVVIICGVGGAIFFVFAKKIMSPKKIVSLRNSIKVGNYKLGIKIAREILSKNADNFEAHYYLGLCYDFEGKSELALIEFKAADKIGVFSQGINEYDLRDRLADLYKKFNKIDEALKEYALMISKNPDDYYVNYKMAELFEIKNNKQQAVAYYTKSFQAKKNFPPVLLNLGVLLYDFKKYSESEKLFFALLKMEPENYKAFFYLGMIYKNQNDNKKALSYFEKAMRDKEFKVRSLGERGMILMASNKFEEATIELERAIKNGEGESTSLILNIRYLLASCYEASRNITEAVKQWEIIYSIKPDFKNIGDKLSTYQDLRMDDRMKDYMTATNEDFISIGKSIALLMGFNVDELNQLPGNAGIEMFVTELNTGGWRNMKKKPKVLRIYRTGTPVDEKALREIIEIMKNKELFKAIIVSASSFSPQALTFASERPIQLIDKNELQNILKNINF